MEILKEASIPRLIQANDESTVAWFKVFLGPNPCSTISRENNVLRYFSNIKYPLLNGVLKSFLNENNLKENVAKTLQFFAENQVPITWIVSPSSTPTNLEEEIMKQGLSITGSLTAMYLDIHRDFVPSTAQSMSESDSLLIKDVSDQRMVDYSVKICNESFNLPDWVSESGRFNQRPILNLEQDNVCDCLAFQNGEPAAAASMILAGGVAGIYAVATKEEYRRKGIASRITSHLIEKAKAMNYQYAILQASSMGLGVYEKLGFKELCSVNLYQTEK